MNVFNGGVYTLPEECAIEFVPIPPTGLDDFRKCWEELLECVLQSFALTTEMLYGKCIESSDLPVPDLIVDARSPR